ncbi:hypothetical protein RJ640_017047 [Escallonia rubra]|uniref:Bet v I/Major latex protein domain-containing protein n=1 Tax=Escallonia rubra TaxID=112253 RepID=A0AA88QZ18_9ASTE|nr:hypothetical protein RJ640_017047 [Escallonia rubra]
MFGTVLEEIEEDMPARKAWEVYGTLEPTKMAAEGLSDTFEKIEVVKGDGGVGTVLKLTFLPVDDVKRVKEAEVVEGGFLNWGFNLYQFASRS